VNGITRIDPIKSSEVTTRDLLFALMTECGASVSSMPTELDGDRAYTSDWELFEPEEVEEPDDLPDYWHTVYDFHFAPDRSACEELGYRYIHAPTEIMPKYPRVPCRGIFCLTDHDLSISEVTGDDLYFIGDEVGE
jgi:hypothetical protein